MLLEVPSALREKDKELHVSTRMPRFERIRRRKFLVFLLVVVLAAGLAYAHFNLSTQVPLLIPRPSKTLDVPKKQYPSFEIPPVHEADFEPPAHTEPTLGASPSAIDPLDPLASLNGPPTDSVWENLRNDTKYMSSWISAGWTNDVMTYDNLIYLALITERVPIIGPFTASHIGHAPPIPFGEVFDMPRLRKLLGKPVLEWREVKKETSDTWDDLGCWSVWQSVQYNDDQPRGSYSLELLKLDISYTTTPTWIKMVPGYEHDQHTPFWAIAKLAYPETRNQSLQTPIPSRRHGVSLPPNEHLVCYDYLYYVAAHQPFEYSFDYSPAWNHVGRHIHWTKAIEDLAASYVRATVGARGSEHTPPYITIHVRHNEFENWCYGVPKVECFANITVIARRVQEVKDELLERKGLDVKHVIMTSDETDPEWWAEVKAQGWLTVDHSYTVKLYGKWYPVFIDAAIQSNGIGFVGTDRSTFSMLADRRVRSWHDGVTRMVKWGTPNADDH